MPIKWAPSTLHYDIMKKAILTTILTLFALSALALNDSTLFEMLKKEKIKHPKIVLAQAKLETGNYKSSLCKNKHNLFGIKSRRGYRTFNTYIECIRYYRDHIQSKYDGHSDYYTFLKRIKYASDPKYIYKLKKLAYEHK